MAEPIEMPFGKWTWVGPRKHVSHHIGVHIGATWYTQLNHPCVAAMQPYVKLLSVVAATQTPKDNLDISYICDLSHDFVVQPHHMIKSHTQLRHVSTATNSITNMALSDVNILTSSLVLVRSIVNYKSELKNVLKHDIQLKKREKNMETISQFVHSVSERWSLRGKVVQKPCLFMRFATRSHDKTTTVLRPFVRDYLGKPVPEETLTHPPS